jgi:ATP-dependent DNA helicase RecQ
VIQLRHFGERYAPPCAACDNCLQPKRLEDWTTEARQFLSAVARLAQRGERFGAAAIIDILRGAETQKLIDRGHQQLSVYGIGKQRSQDEWRVLVRALLQRGLVDETSDGYPVLTLNAESRAVLKGEQPVLVAPPEKREKAVSRRKANGETAPPLPADEALFEQLRALRKRLADVQGVPPYVVFSDATLRDMAARRPCSDEAFLAISGVGARKLAQYGPAFLELVSAFESGAR